MNESMAPGCELQPSYEQSVSAPSYLNEALPVKAGSDLRDVRSPLPCQLDG